jgi:hypothetical protein
MAPIPYALLVTGRHADDERESATSAYVAVAANHPRGFIEATRTSLSADKLIAYPRPFNAYEYVNV